MSLTIYHLKTCDTCRKAIKSLQATGHDIILIDVRADGMSENILQDLIKTQGWEVMLNRRSTTWRGLDESDKENITPESALSLMSRHPTLIKRPVIMSADKVTIGWSKDSQALWG